MKTLTTSFFEPVPSHSGARWVFIQSLLRNPKAVGAVLPSSSRLSRLIASRVDMSGAAGSTILEVGAGTGSITRALLSRGIHPDRLILIERDPSLATYLRERFPRVRVKCGDAMHAHSILSSEAIPAVNTVVSSLPMCNLDVREQIAIVRAMMKSLAPGGELLQFTYSSNCPLPVRRLGLNAERLGRVWMNVPPASVWRFTRQ